ncbi:hypothetical protein E1218_35205 [Kribbella turkmenica]|uniref:Uncharacterized protein n=1 Tax=Kribbella turkmenica TaxID=2530375 RepID=A0A4R4W2Z9_9ACTN|nr:hypothetical protein [Kribbella turkmenica]TDD12918.1 hypothetical protein E1218_35205 [Kribbella turkmenica]
MRPDSEYDERVDRERPEAPDSWRSLMSADYDYPEEIDELNGRERRRAKKNWRRDDHAQRMAWLRSQRQAEPTSPAVIVALVVVLAIIILGLGGGLPRLLGDDGPEDSAPIGLLTPGRSVVLPTAPSNPQPGQDSPRPTTPTLTTPPPQTQRPSSEATALANDVVGTWARTFYTRDPAAETYAALVAKSAKYMTEDVASSFTSAGDPTYDALKKDGGKSTVIAAPVSAPPANAEAPVDTPARITRFVKVTIDVTGKNAQRFDVPLLVTLVNQNSQWVISDVSGGTGP